MLLHLAGIDVVAWLKDLWHQIKEVLAGYIVAALVFQTGQTLLAGLSYYGHPAGRLSRRGPALADRHRLCRGLAMNNFLPANIGTFVTLLMFVALIPSATFAGSIAAYLVQKIFFTIAGTFVYLYLFLSVPGSFTRTSATSPITPVTSVLIASGSWC